MGTMERLLAATREIWDGYHDHPFVRGIREGDLPQEKFRYYIIQDYLYLVEYAKVFAIGMTKARSLEGMQLFADYIHTLINEEMDIHKGYMGRLGITREEIAATPVALDNRSYTAYMLSAAYEGGEAEALAAILACAVSYEVIGQTMVARRPECVDHPLYGDWIRGYASERYREENIRLTRMLEKMTADYGPAQLQRIQEIFVDCSRYEMRFWDLSWRAGS